MTDQVNLIDSFRKEIWKSYGGFFVGSEMKISLDTGAKISNQLSLTHIGDKEPVAGPGDSYIGESFYLVLRPDARLELVEAHQENAGVIEPFGAVNGGYAYSLGRNVIRSLCPVVL